MSTYGPTGSELTGNYEPALEQDVRAGVQYGSNGTEFTGTLDVDASGDMPATTDVRDGVVYASGASTGVLGLPAEAEVLINVGYGANDTEFVGQLQPTGGGGGLIEPIVDVLGRIRSPLVIGRDYVQQYGTSFNWRLPLDFDATSGVGKFRGRQQGCLGASSCPTSYDWDVESLSITQVIVDGTTYYDFVFELTEAETSVLAPGMYDWWVSWESATGEEIQLQSGTVEWVCG